MEHTRARNYRGLIEHFEAHTYADASSPIPRYAAVSEEFFDMQRVGATIVLCDTEQEAFEFRGGSVLEGYAPDGVYDLDTAQKIDVEVSTPIVTRALHHGVSREPARRIGQRRRGVRRVDAEALTAVRSNEPRGGDITVMQRSIRTKACTNRVTR